MKKANIANLMYQMAQVAVMIGTGGYGAIGTYYLMQAGFLGLGMVDGKRATAPHALVAAHGSSLP